MLTFENIKPLFEVSPSAYLIVLPNAPYFTIKMVNKAFFSVFNSTSRDIIEKELSNAFPDHTAQQNLEAIKASLERSLNLKAQHKIILQGFGLKTFSIDILPLLDENNEVQFLALHIAPVTDNKISLSSQSQKKQISTYNNKIANILESVTDGFFAVDRNWTVTYWNKEAERLMGISAQDIIGKNLWEVFPESVSLKYYSEQHRAMTENISVRFEEYEPVRDTYVEVTVFPSEDGLSIYFKDIKERKQAEEQLNQERERYQTLFNLSPMSKWVYDVATLQFLDVNNAAINHYGYSREEFLCMTLRDIRPEQDIKILEEIINNKIKQGVPNNISVKHRKKSGEVIYVNISGRSIQWKGKNARLIVAVDNTEKLKAEQQLAASEKRFKALAQDSSDLIAITDKVGNYLYVSPTSKSILGVEAAYFVGKNVLDFVHEQDKALVVKQFGELAFKKRIEMTAFRFMDAKKSFRWIETIVTDMTDEPAVGGVVVNSRDVTKRIENETKTKESIERYNIVSKATSDVIWDWDLISGNTFWNKGLKGIFGYNLTTTTHEWWSKKIHPEDIDKLASHLDTLIKKKKSRLEIEYRFLTAGGNYKYVLDRAFILFNEAGEPIRMIGAMQDITERINYIRDIENKNKRLREIAWTQSHIVRTPVSRIMGLADLLYHSDNNAERKQLLIYLKTSAQEMDAIIRDIAKNTEGI